MTAIIVPTVVRTSSKEVETFNTQNAAAISAGLFPMQRLHQDEVEREARIERVAKRIQEWNNIVNIIKSIANAVAAENNVAPRNVCVDEWERKIKGSMYKKQQVIQVTLKGVPNGSGGTMSRSRTIATSDENKMVKFRTWLSKMYKEIAEHQRALDKAAAEVKAASESLSEDLKARIVNMIKLRVRDSSNSGFQFSKGLNSRLIKVTYKCYNQYASRHSDRYHQYTYGEYVPEHWDTLCSLEERVAAERKELETRISNERAALMKVISAHATAVA